RAELAKAKAPEERQQLLNKLSLEYKNKSLHPYIAAARGYIDSVIEPAETRPTLVRALEYLLGKREVRVRTPPRKHGLIPV
ncbi:MAG: carboxyl transferase domain-containing protein, partial [Zestosphaera sp.]